MAVTHDYTREWNARVPWSTWFRENTNVPNALGVFRGLAAFGVFVLVYFYQNWFAAWALFAVAGASDFIDGKIARAWNQETAFGAQLDQYTDKMLVGIALLALCLTTAPGYAWLALALIVLRDIIVSVFRVGLDAHGRSLSVTGPAKLKTTLQMLTIGGVLLWAALGYDQSHWYVAIGFVTVFTVWTGVTYALSAYDEMLG